MDKIKIPRRCTTDGYWLKCISSNGAEDGLQAVGWRYKSNGCLCYELFCIGHVQLYYPLDPGVLDKILYLLKGQEPTGAHLLKIDFLSMH